MIMYLDQLLPWCLTNDDFSSSVIFSTFISCHSVTLRNINFSLTCLYIYLFLLVLSALTSGFLYDSTDYNSLLSCVLMFKLHITCFEHQDSSQLHFSKCRTAFSTTVCFIFYFLFLLELAEKGDHISFIFVFPMSDRILGSQQWLPNTCMYGFVDVWIN